jgi:2',3'-cyclic-nucleotide 2'-phosphodiesterase (5'-nucleotidase family)
MPKIELTRILSVHGWIAGHPHNATLNADFGDFCSLIYHMNENARSQGFEFLLFDSGDVIEGTGISDATPIHGQYIFPVVEKVQNYTALTIGNHGNA